MADLHSHALLPMYYYRKNLDVRTSRPFYLPYTPFGTHIDVPGIRASGMKLMTFCVYALFRFPHRNCFETAQAQITLFERFVARHSDLLVHARSAAEIESIVRSGKVAAVLALEGAHHLGNSLETMDYFVGKGVFYVTLVHFINTPVGDTYLTTSFSSFRGLRPFGRDLITEMERRGLIVDVAHASEKLFWDVMEHAKRPPIYSHGGCRKLCNISRNLSDEQSREIIKRGGLIGVILYPHYLRKTGVWGKIDDVVRHIDHWLALGGENALSIGSDMSGVAIVREIGNIAGLPKLQDAMVKKFGEAVSRKLLFDNAVAYLRRNWLGGDTVGSEESTH